MKKEIIFPAGLWTTLKKHLLTDGGQEQLAFLLAGVAKGHGWLRLLVREIIPVPKDAFDDQTAYNLTLKPAFSQAILSRCYEEGLSMIEVHSHPFAHRFVTFSVVDLANEAKKFRYVEHKIPFIHHATLVVGQADLDAHLWNRRRKQTDAIDRVRVLGSPIVDFIPTSSHFLNGNCGAPEAWLDRQVLAFGEEGQKRLQGVRVGVVGCGGTGSVVIQMLAHLGVNHLICIDPDIVELSNLNRLVGAKRSDAKHSRSKVQVAQRLVWQINPKAHVKILNAPLSDPGVISMLKGVDMLFGCTDNHGSRLQLNQLAVQYLIPYLDLGAGLKTTGGKLTSAGGQVRLVLPGAFCLSCIDGIDRIKAANDLMSPLGWNRQVARGYIQNEDTPTPAVLFLNSVIASMAVAEFVNLWTGYRSPTPLLYFDLLKSSFISVEAERQESCISCGTSGSFALGDLDLLPGTSDDALPDSIPFFAGEEGGNLCRIQSR